MPFVLPDLTVSVVTIVSILQLRRLRFKEMKERPGQSQNSTLNIRSEQKPFLLTLSPLLLMGKGAQRETQKGLIGKTRKVLGCPVGRTSEGARPLG